MRDILTKSTTHPHGIKVRLEGGIVGRVKDVLWSNIDFRWIRFGYPTESGRLYFLPPAIVIQCYIPVVQRNNDLLDISKLIVYYPHMIKSFHCCETEKIFHREHSRKFPLDIQQRAFMKLNAVDAAIKIEDLRLPPSNHLEVLKGKRQGQWSIRINDQWRICFVWHNGNAEKVKIVDYH